MGLIDDWIGLDSLFENQYTETAMELIYTFAILMPVI